MTADTPSSADPIDDRGRFGGSRGRQRVGLAILAGLMIVAVVVGTMRNGVIAGNAIATSVPDPPRPGDCLLQNPYAPELNLHLLGPSMPLPNLPTTQCDGVRYGEVTSLATGVGLDYARLDQAWQSCSDDSYEYLAIPPQEPPAGPEHVPIAFLNMLLVGPDDRQRAAGQDWSACVAYLPPSIGDQGDGTVDHSLSGAWTNTEDSQLFVLCHTDPQLQDASSCWQPHQFEQIAYWRGDLGASEEAIREECILDAIQWLGSPAALDRGDLTVMIERIGWDAATGGMRITAPGTSEDSYVDCLLTPTDPGRHLTGPLRGLGNGPTPLS